MKSDIIEKAKAEVKANKQPRTIKVKTVIISLVIAVALVASFITGWTMSKADTSQRQAESDALVQKALDNVSKTDAQK